MCAFPPPWDAEQLNTLQYFQPDPPQARSVLQVPNDMIYLATSGSGTQ